MDKIWYIHVSGKTYGPYTKEEVKGMLQAGSIKYTDFVFKEDYDDWKYLYEVKLFDRRGTGRPQPRIKAPKKVDFEDTAPPVTKDESVVQWYLHDGKNQYGPYSTEYIRDGLDNKTIFWTYYVWRKGLDKWVQLKKSKEFDRRSKKTMPKAAKQVHVTNKIEEIKNIAVDYDELTSSKTQAKTLANELHLDAREIQVLRGSYPTKLIILGFVILLIVFTAIYKYPWFLEQLREVKALKAYNKSVELISHGDKVNGYTDLFTVIQAYPRSEAKKKAKKFLILREEKIKDNMKFEARRISRLIQSFIRRYGVPPANAIDMGYIPNFFVRFFAKVYYKENGVIIYGHRDPISNYIFTIENNVENESIKTLEELNLMKRSYVLLLYSGQKSNLKPLNRALFKKKVKKKLQQ